MPTADRSSIGRRAKARGKADERWVANRIGGYRHPADTGGGEDVHFEGLCIQVKGGVRLLNNTIRFGLDSARATAATAEIGCLVVVDRPRGRRLRSVIVFDFEEWCDLNGYHPRSEADETAEQFAVEYAERPGVTVEYLRDAGRMVEECDCSICEGWQMGYKDIRERAGQLHGKLSLLDTVKTDE